jgi:putative Mg2+ transporter-C (MgtC) family protein
VSDIDFWGVWSTLSTQFDALGRLLLAAALGALIGAERELRQRAAGFRTNTLIAVGSAAFTLVSIHMAAEDGGDPTRIPSQIVTGIGFLGGGAILRGGRGDIRGLTTAATVWVNAAIGMACGAGFYSLAITSTLVTLFVLTMFLRVENHLAKRSRAEEPPDPIIKTDIDRNQA